MNIKTVYSSQTSVDTAIEEVRANLKGFDAKTILYFCSSKFDPSYLASKLALEFPATQTFGCTTAGEIVSGKMLNDSIVAMAFDQIAINDLRIEVVENLSEKIDVMSVFNEFEKHFGCPALEMNPEQYVGIILVDGLSGAEEKLMDQIGDKCNLTFIGGSAGDDLKFKKTFVFANGKSYSNAAVLALLKPGLKFDFLKTQSFRNLDKVLVATEVDENNRVIKTLNNIKAADAYAEALGVSKANLDRELFAHPVGLVVNDEPYIRSPQAVAEDGSIKFYCNVKEGTELRLMESEDIVSDTKKALEFKKSQFKDVSAVINFNCILRTLELKNKNQTDEYGKLFASVPTIGFSTYGEEYIGHINQTATMLIFGEN